MQFGGRKKGCVVSCGKIGRCVPVDTQRQSLASVINWFHEAEPEPDLHEARIVCSSPFCARESRHKDFPGSSINEVRGS